MLLKDEAWRERQRAYGRKSTIKGNRKAKQRVLDAYGGRCSCCGEAEPAFLCVDHMNNDGAAHREEIGYGRTSDGRRKVGSGSVIHHWLIKNNFPEGFQLLCANCNMAKQSLGKCPHVDMAQ